MRFIIGNEVDRQVVKIRCAGYLVCRDGRERRQDIMLKANDKALIKKLIKYDVLAEYYRAIKTDDKSEKKYIEEHGIAPDVLAELKAAGLAFDFESITHDEALKRCFSHAKRLNRKSVANHFIVGLARQRPELRAGLSAYAIMQTMPSHGFEANAAGYCGICSGVAEEKYLDRTALNRMRFAGGWLSVHKTPLELHFYLEQESLLDEVVPNEDDVRVLGDLLSLIHRTDANGPTQLAKEIKAVKALGLSTFEARGVVDTLGMCGVLSTKEHPGYESRFTNPGLAPSKSKSSDWSYPVDFWSKRDGVNEAALQFWFGHILSGASLR